MLSYFLTIFSEKPGRCPWRRSIVRLCLLRADTCENDQECPDDNKCCHDGCSRSCAQPVSEDKPGQCPKVDKENHFCDKKGDMCDKDADCPGSRKCCHNGCQRDCSMPESVRKLKPGVCPKRGPVDPKLCKITKNECEMDGDCFGHLKCCFNGCHNECFRTPRPRPKRGECPPSEQTPPKNCSDTTDRCDDDSQCPGRGKCCFSGCHKDCITPPVKKKPGVCPLNDYIPAELCEVTDDQCKEDEDCKGRDKCCFSGCNLECMTPPVKKKPGECPLNDFIPPELCEVTEDQCKEDEDCKGRDKCCATGCNLECITPPIREKPGQCPTVDFINRESCEETTDQCSEDFDCKGRDKCCATGCINECVTPPRPRPIPIRKKGHCPKPWKGLDGICDRRGDMCSNDDDCNGVGKCCFNGCQKDCIDPVPEDKPGECPSPWKGQDGICDRRGDMCSVDIDCDASEKCCFNGCQRDCVKPGIGKTSAEKPGQCPNPWKEQPCDRRGDMCQEDVDCTSGSKCCHNGCQKDCVKPGEMDLVVYLS